MPSRISSVIYAFITPEKKKKSNVSCFTCIKLYKLDAWPDFLLPPSSTQGSRESLPQLQAQLGTPLSGECWPFKSLFFSQRALQVLAL